MDVDAQLREVERAIASVEATKEKLELEKEALVRDMECAIASMDETKEKLRLTLATLYFLRATQSALAPAPPVYKECGTPPKRKREHVGHKR